MYKFNLIEKLNEEIKATVKFDIMDRGGIYTDQNNEQRIKLTYYLKSLLLAYIDIHNNRNIYEIYGLLVKETLEYLEIIIKEYAIKYSNDNLTKNEIDVFTEHYLFAQEKLYYTPLIKLLFKVCNMINNEGIKAFVERFFQNSNDLGRMLMAINVLESKELKNIVADQISKVNLNDYIKTRFTITEIQNTLIESINSDDQWHTYTEPLLINVVDHFAKRKGADIEVQQLLYEINLLLAFKKKDLDKLRNIEIPESKVINLVPTEKHQNRKRFFIALFNLYYDKLYEEAVRELENLLIVEPNNVYFAFHIYKAETLNGIELKQEELITKAYNKWTAFLSRQNNQKDNITEQFNDTIEQNNIHYYVATKNIIRFDQVVNQLPAKYLYDEEIASDVFNCYHQRELHELAFEYIVKATLYYEKNGMPVPDIIKIVKEKYPDSEALKKIKIILSTLSSQRLVDIPKIIPNNLNGYVDLNDFIFFEIIQATRVMVDKIEAIRDIKDENRYNDLLLAILRLRLPLWGWSIHDQSRTGKSINGKNAGEADHFIQYAGNNIALIEALILRDKKYTQKHVLKCPFYIKSIERYYIVIYYNKKEKDFSKNWEKYKNDVLSAKLPINFKLAKKSKFIDLQNKYTDVNHLKLAKTLHGKNIELYHIMINFGQ